MQKWRDVSPPFYCIDKVEMCAPQEEEDDSSGRVVIHQRNKKSKRGEMCLIHGSPICPVYARSLDPSVLK
jgi:hypothetical protein